MKKRISFGQKLIVLVVFSLFTSHFSLFARGAQELVSSGHWVYDALTALSLEMGIRNFADSAPLTIAEITSYLLEIDYDRLSDAGKAQWQRIHDYIGAEGFTFISDAVSVSTEPSASLEGFYKTNDDIDWVYDRYSRDNLISLPVTISVKDWITLGSELHLAENKGVMLHDDNYTNVPTKDTDFDVNFPSYGYLSTGYAFTEKTGISFQLGMGEQSIGRTQTGSILLSDYMTGATFGKLSLYSPNFKYTFDTIQLNVDKYMYYHAFEARFFKKCTFTFMEATLTNAEWELRYLNPLMIYHGMAPWRDYSADDANNGEFMGLKLDWAPFRFVRFYGMFAMNQYQVPYERRDFPDSLTPNSLGGQVGVESMIPLGDGYAKIAAEGYYAQPTLYVKQSPDWSFFRTYTDNIGDNQIFYEWTGSPFGPDTIAGELSVGYEKPGKWSLDVIYLFLVQGDNAEKTIFYDAASDTWYSSTDNDNEDIREAYGTEATIPDNWAYPTKGGKSRDAQTPSGCPKYTHRVSVRGKWHANEWLTFTCQPSFVVILNNVGASGFHERGNTDFGFEIAASVSINFINLKK